MEVGFHTEAFNSAYWGFGKCLDDAYRSVIEGSDVVIIANAAKFHPLHFKAAVEAGKHGDYMVRRTPIALIGLFSCYSGKGVTWDRFSKSAHLSRPKTSASPWSGR
jgi:hypothetical protein